MDSSHTLVLPHSATAVTIAVGIARAVIIADERLHARAQPVERHTYHPVCTEHYGERGGVIGIAARICL